MSGVGLSPHCPVLSSSPSWDPLALSHNNQARLQTSLNAHPVSEGVRGKGDQRLCKHPMGLVPFLPGAVAPPAVWAVSEPPRVGGRVADPSWDAASLVLAP